MAELQMYKITLICSAHRENGLCNSEELLAILRAVDPEVAFLEVPPLDQQSLESRALQKYCEFKRCELVHVDQYELPRNLSEAKSEIDLVFDYVAQRSEDYDLLEGQRHDDTSRYGFRYLNSAAFADQWRRMVEIEDKIVSESGDERPKRALQWWRHLMQAREREMVNAIYQYSREKVFDIGVFLVGANHRTGIAREIERHRSAHLIDWDFFGADSAPRN